MATADTIKRNFDEYKSAAEDSLAKKRFNAAVILYYKALLELCDTELLRRNGRIGANHNERFEMLRESSPKLYDIASPLFKFYRDTYNNNVSEQIARLVGRHVEDAEKIVFTDKKMDKE